MRTLTVAAAQARPAPGDVPANAALGGRSGTPGRAAPGSSSCPSCSSRAYHPPTLYAQDVSATHVPPTRRAWWPTRGSTRCARPRPTARPWWSSGRRSVTPTAAGRVRPLWCVRSGTVVAAYDKQNLWGPDERALFSAGRPRGHAGGGRLAARARRLLRRLLPRARPGRGRGDGAHAYLCPAGYLAGSEHRRDVYYAARALDNTMYVVFANSVGAVGGAAVQRRGGGLRPGGARARPRGRTRARRWSRRSFDPAELARVRSRHTMLLDRPRDPGAQRSVVRV